MEESIMKKIVAIAALSAALTTPAFAAGNNAYLFGDLSSASYGNIGGYASPGKIAIGAGLDFTPNIAGEIGLHIFGDSTLTNGFQSSTLKVSSFTLAGVGTLPINQQFSAFGKLGLAMNKLEQTGTLFAPLTSNNTSLYFAFGGQFDLNLQFAIRAQYENFGDLANINQKPNASAIGIAGLVYF